MTTTFPPFAPFAAFGAPTQRSPQAHAGDYANILDHDGKGNGIADNTGAFNATLAAGDVFFPPGTYRFASQPNAITTARSIIGAGRTATTILIDYTDGDFLRIGNGAGAVPAFPTVEGLTILANVNRTSGSTIRVFPAHHAVIRDIALSPGGVSGAQRHFNGIQVDGGANQFGCHIEDFEISLTQGFGIATRFGPQDIYIRDGVIGSAGTAGIDLQSGSGLYLTDVDIINSLYGVFSEPGAGDTIFGLFCDAVLGDTSTVDNWHFWGTGKVGNVHLTDCWASASAGAVGFSINNPNLDGLTLANSTSHGNWLHGVHVNQGKNVTVTAGCQIGMNSMAGDLAANEIEITGGVSRVSISDNVIGRVGIYAANGFASRAAFGVRIGAGAGDWISVTGNKIDSGIDATGLCLATGANVVVQGNLGWKTSYSGVGRVAAGQQSVTFPHNLIVSDPTKIVASISAAVNPFAAGITHFWAVQPTVGIGGNITVSTDVVAAHDFFFAFRIWAFE